MTACRKSNREYEQWINGETRQYLAVLCFLHASHEHAAANKNQENVQGHINKRRGAPEVIGISAKDDAVSGNASARNKQITVAVVRQARLDDTV